MVWSAVITGIFTAIVVSTLSARVPDILEAPFVRAERDWRPLALPLLETAGPPPPMYVLRLRLEDPFAPFVHAEMHIPFALDDREIELTGATLRLLGTNCTYDTRPGARLVANRELPFIRGADCLRLRSAPTGLAELRVELAHRARVAVWTYQPLSRPAATNLIQVITAPGYEGAFPLLLAGKYATPLPNTDTRRIDLLGYMWQVSTGVEWIWSAIAVAAVLLFAGIVLFPDGPLCSSVPRLAFAARATAAAGAFAAALGLCYAVMVPPFQAADESNHFLGFGEVAKRPDIVTEAAEWSAITHFTRLRFNRDERFRPVDMMRRGDQWIEEATTLSFSRSSNVRLWFAFDRYFRNLPIPQALLGLRLLNVAIFVASVAVATAAGIWLIDAPFPQLLPFVFLFVPGVAFFATYVSNYASLTSAYVLFASGVAATILGGSGSHFAGLALGLGLGLAMITSRSALPMLTFVGFVWLARVVAGSSAFSGWRRAVLEAGWFWGSFGAGLAAAQLLVSGDYQIFVDRRSQMPLEVWITSYLPAGADGRPWLPWSIEWAAGVVLLVGLAGEVVFARVRKALGDPLQSRGTTLIQLIASALAVILAALMVASLFVAFPTVPTIDPQTRSSFEYIWWVMLSEFGFFRLTRPDFLLSSSFWVGFGWLETIPPDWFICTLSGLSGIALLGVLLHIQSSKRGALLAAMLIVAAGFVATLIAYVVVTVQFAAPVVHGRYLIGLYLAVLPICWLLPVIKPNTGAFTWWRFRTPVLLSLCAGVHAYSLSFILQRYF